MVSSSSSSAAAAASSSSSSSSSAPLKVLVIGSGTLGSSILGGLAAINNDKNTGKAFDVSLLVRDSSLTDAAKADKFAKLREQGVHFVSGDASEPIDQLAAKFAPFHTIVSAVGPGVKPAEVALIDAAKKAGVKRYVPSSFGFDLQRVGRGSAVSVLDDKLDVEEYLKASGLDYLVFYSGLFTEYLFSPFFGVDVANGEVTTQVSFETRVSHTSLQDIGAIVGAALLDSSLSRQIVHIGSETLSYEQIVQVLEKSGVKVTRKVTPRGGNREAFSSADFFTGLRARFLDVVSTPDAAIDVEHEAWNKKALAAHHTVTAEEYVKKIASTASSASSQ